MVTYLTRDLLQPTLIVVGDLLGQLGLEPGSELWRVAFRGWDEPHELRARARCRPRRFVVVDADGLVRASGRTPTFEYRSGEPFRLVVSDPRAA